MQNDKTKTGGCESARVLDASRGRASATRYEFDPRDDLSLELDELPPMPAAPTDGSPEPLYIVPLPDECCEPLVPAAECCLLPDCCPELAPDCRCCDELLPDAPSIDPLVPLP